MYIVSLYSTNSIDKPPIDISRSLLGCKIAQSTSLVYVESLLFYFMYFGIPISVGREIPVPQLARRQMFL